MAGRTKRPAGTVRNPELTRKRILEAALREFSAHGFAGARVDVIARAARINKRMLYHYFGDKEALFREILRLKISARTSWLTSAPRDLWQSLPFWFELMSQDPEWIRLLQWEALQWGEKKLVIDEEQRRRNFQRAVARVRQQQTEGVIPPDLDPGQLLLSVLALTAYPFAFPHLARLITGHATSSKEFQNSRTVFLKRLAVLLESGAKTPVFASC